MAIYFLLETYRNKLHTIVFYRDSVWDFHRFTIGNRIQNGNIFLISQVLMKILKYSNISRTKIPKTTYRTVTVA